MVTVSGINSCKGSDLDGVLIILIGAFIFCEAYIPYAYDLLRCIELHVVNLPVNAFIAVEFAFNCLVYYLASSRARSIISLVDIRLTAPSVQILEVRLPEGLRKADALCLHLMRRLFVRVSIGRELINDVNRGFFSIGPVGFWCLDRMKGGPAEIEDCSASALRRAILLGAAWSNSSRGLCPCGCTIPGGQLG